MTSKTAEKAEIKQAKSEFAGLQDGARRELEAMTTAHRFAMVGECRDKHGDLTRVLEIDTDAEGILGLFMEIGQPYTFSLEKDVLPEDRMKKDNAKLNKFLAVMANVDLSDKEVLKAVGWTALAGARSIADSFFTLRLVADTQLELGTGS